MFGVEHGVSQDGGKREGVYVQGDRQMVGDGECYSEITDHRMQ